MRKAPRSAFERGDWVLRKGYRRPGTVIICFTWRGKRLYVVDFRRAPVICDAKILRLVPLRQIKAGIETTAARERDWIAMHNWTGRQ